MTGPSDRSHIFDELPDGRHDSSVYGAGRGGGRGMQYQYDHYDAFKPLVFDIGGSLVKGGFGGDAAPTAGFATVVGRPRRFVTTGMAETDSYVGDEAVSKRASLWLHWPIVHGVVSNWDDYEKVVHHMLYNELRVAPEEHQLLLAVSAACTDSERTKTTQVYFETFNVVGLYRASSAELALLAAGCGTTKVVLESGDGFTAAVPVIDGVAVANAVASAPFGGGDVTRALEAALGLPMAVPGMAGVAGPARAIKTQHAHVLLDPRRADEHQGRQTYRLASEEDIVLGRELFTCPELLFSYGSRTMRWEVARVLLLGRRDSDCPLSWLPHDVFMLVVQRVNRRGWSDLVDAALAACPAPQRAVLRGAVVLAGGNTLLRGAPERLARELPGTRVVADPGRAHLAWRGGSIRAMQPDVPWVSMAHYDEHGPDRCWEPK